MNFFASRIPVSATLAAARKKALVEAIFSLHISRNETASARQAFAEETAALAALEREFAEMASFVSPDNAEIDAHVARKTRLPYKIDDQRQRVDDAQKRLAALEAVVEEARAAVLKALADRGASPVDGPADLPRLQAETVRASEAAEKALAHLGQLEAQAAPALAAYEGLQETGAPKDRAAKVLDDADEWRDKIKQARAEHELCAVAARDAVSRVQALQARLDAESAQGAFEAGLRALETRKAGLVEAGADYDRAGERMASLIASSGVFLQALDAAASRAEDRHVEKYGVAFMRSRSFLEAARVPIIGNDGFFVSPHWTHTYQEFALRRDLLDPLQQMIADRNANFDMLFKTGSMLFAEEYEAIAQDLLAALAPLFAWSADRDQIFAEAGEAARSVARPSIPFSYRQSEDRIWRRLSLPSLRANGAPIWAPDFDPRNLSVLLKRSEAA